MEEVMKCMKLMDSADKIVNGLENENQLIMLLGTMTDKWFSKHKVDEENAIRILELLAIEIGILLFDDDERRLK